MPRTYGACLIGCGRMGATIDDEVEGRPDSYLWQPFSHAAAAVACDRTDLVAVADVVAEESGIHTTTLRCRARLHRLSADD